MSDVVDTAIFGRDRALAEIDAALRGTEVSGVVIEGEHGMGKSRIAARVHADRGGQETWIRGDRVLEAVPFGAFGLLVDLDGEPETVLARVVAALTEGPGTPVVFADDAHCLDESSLSALWQLASDGEIKVVATMTPTVDGRTGSFGELVADGVVHHILLEPLTLDDVSAMLEHHLGGIVSHGALDVAAFQSSGVPGLIIELLRYARRRRRLVLQRGVWLLDGLDIDYDQRARDLVSSDLSRYTDEQREALELVVLAGEVEVELMLAAGLGEAADSLVAAGVLDLGGRGRPIYTCIESYSTETVRNTVPVGRSRQMFALVESHPGTPSKRARMLRADWALSCGAKVSVADSVEAARVAAGMGEWQRALRILAEVPSEVMDAPALFDLGTLYCDVNLIPVGCDVLAQAIRKTDDPFLVVEAFVVWVLRDVERISPPLSGADFVAALDRIQAEAAAAGRLDDAVDAIDLARATLERVSESSWEGLPGDDGSVLTWLGAEGIPETLRVAITMVVAAKELERGHGNVVGDLLDRIEGVSENIGSGTIILDLARSWAHLQSGDREAAAAVLAVPRSTDLAYRAAGSGARDLIVTRLHAEAGRWDRAFRRACAAAEAIEYWQQYEFAALALAQAQYAAMMVGNAEAADDFDARYLDLPPGAAYVESRRAQILRLVVRAKLTGRQRYREELDAALLTVEERGALAAAACARIEIFVHFGDYDAEAMCRLAASLDGGDRDGRLLGELGAALCAEDAEALVAFAQRVSPQLPALVDRCLTLAESWAESPPPHRHRVHDVELTSREQQISRLIIAGLTNAEIADELGVAVRTVEGHTYRLYRKLDITSRSEVAEAITRLRNDAPA